MDSKKEFTKQCLAEALINLLDKQEYSKIRIQDVVNKAGFSRMAYYRNFESIDDILRYYLYDVTSKWLLDNKVSFSRMDSKTYLLHLFNHLLSTKKISLILLKTNKLNIIQEVLDYFFLKKVDNDEDAQFYYFVSGGLFNIYHHWLLEGMKTSPETLSSYLTNLVDNIKK